ncbi:MAG: gliding motility lipoprotein GldD [Bacteroides sp.]
MKTKKKHSLFMAGYTLLLFVLFVVACNGTQTTTKTSTETLPTPVYTLSTDTVPFRFDVSNQAKFSSQQTKKNEYFCNITYPALNAQLYCTWHRIEPIDFSIVAEESHRLVYQHTEMATAIKEHLYANDSSRVYGILYDIQGNVATPLQLALTDSNSYFFNASLYFNSVPNADSIAPVLEYIRKDVVRLMETYRSR